MKMNRENERENESKNDHFCKIEGRVQFFKNDHFRVILDLIFNPFFKNEIENEIENEPKMAIVNNANGKLKLADKQKEQY
jgi:hypothetical protein